jgi:Recombination endonuclease VII
LKVSANKKTHCKNGHPLVEGTGRKIYKVCRKKAAHRHYLRNKEEVLRKTKEYAQAHPEIPRRSHENRRLREHILTEEQLNKKLEDQGHVCAICGGDNDGKALCIDHDHNCCSGETSCEGCTRGLLCTRCNKKLHAIEDQKFLKAAISYLSQWRKRLSGK